MDRSIDFDSIGSCSLDADSTDFSDTSESCNFISPSATREDFTAGIAERVRRIQTTQPLTPKLILNQPLNQRTLSTSTTTNTTTTTAYFDINSGKISTIVSRPPDSNGCYFNGSTEKFLNSKTIDLQSPTVVANASKKPSYLNLACCVNGYSNYTNYDSVERKEINKSREASPIRPIITMSRQPRSNDNLLSVPTPVTFVKQSPLTSITKRFASLNIGSDSDKDSPDNAGVNGVGSVPNRKSFIQQRVEKLYGTTKILTNTTVKNSETFQINGNGHYHVNGTTTTNGNHVVDEKENDEEFYMNSLPVMKHLRPEFCRQLQFLSSPKKVARVSNANSNSPKSNNNNQTVEIKKKNLEEEKIVEISDQDLRPETKESVVMEHIISKDEADKAVMIQESQGTIIDLSNNNNVCVNNKMENETIISPQTEVKDGHYFLRLLNIEKSRILKLADEAEKELELLQSDPATVPTEDIIGLILSAVGKSRLLATKKFKQFEGLCHENLNPKTDDGPQTLAGDLQGFWDMMMLQVDNIDAAFDDLRQCRENGWKKQEAPSPQAPKGSRLTKRPLTQSQAAKGKTTSVTVKKPSSAPSNSEAAQKREEQRKKLMEMKRKLKASMQNGNGNDQNDGIPS